MLLLLLVLLFVFVVEEDSRVLDAKRWVRTGCCVGRVVEEFLESTVWFEQSFEEEASSFLVVVVVVVDAASRVLLNHCVERLVGTECFVYPILESRLGLFPVLLPRQSVWKQSLVFYPPWWWWLCPGSSWLDATTPPNHSDWPMVHIECFVCPIHQGELPGFGWRDCFFFLLVVVVVVGGGVGKESLPILVENWMDSTVIEVYPALAGALQVSSL